MGKIFPHRRHKARLPSTAWPPHPVENDAERRERIAKERESRRRLDDDRARRMAERREKRERVAASWAEVYAALDPLERLAQGAFPWPLIARECRLFDDIVLPAPTAPTPRDFPFQRRGLIWSTHLVFGEFAFEALHKFHPSADETEPITWRLITALCLVTTDRQKLAKVAEFFEAAVSVIHPGCPDREAFLQAAALARNLSRNWLAARIEAAREGRDGFSLTELGDGWFRIGDKAVTRLFWKNHDHLFGRYGRALAKRAPTATID
jgi:hypothetical protein